MTEPRIHYAQTKDATSIAYYTRGDGKAFVHLPDFVHTHIGLDGQSPLRRWWDYLAEKRRLIRFDGRGTGLSEREASDYSLDSRNLDLEAVVDRLGLEKFALFGMVSSGLWAISYAARYPDRVSHLILWCSYARASDYFESPEVKALVGLVDADWDTYVNTFAHSRAGGWVEDKSARWLSTMVRENVTQEAVKAYYAAVRELDVSPLLPQVRSPTLVLHRRHIRWLTVDVAQSLASQIPDAQLALLEGTSAVPSVGDMESVERAIDEFLGQGDESAAASKLPEDMAVILFADVADSTGLTERLGDMAFREKARELDMSLRAVIRECSGTPVEGKVLGDGVLAVFSSARQAIDCALRCAAAGEPLGLRLHLGIHAGDVIREGNNVYGGAVNMAARIATASEPGEVLVSDVLRGLARTSAGVAFEDRGAHELKGIEEPQRLFAVRGGADG